jgi:hypothetical protein
VLRSHDNNTKSISARIRKTTIAEISLLFIRFQIVDINDS